MYYSLITSLLTVLLKIKDCIATAMGPKKEVDTEPDQVQLELTEPEPEPEAASLAPEDEKGASAELIGLRTGW